MDRRDRRDKDLWFFDSSFPTPAPPVQKAMMTLFAMSHSNIFACFSYGVHEGQAYFLTEHIRDRSLREYADGRALPIRDAVALGISLARTVSFIHKRGIAQLDLMPPGIYVTDAMEARLDLRRTIERRIAGERWIHGGVSGTEAPEILRGDAGEIGPAADVYSVGAILYRMLTGIAPAIGTEVGPAAITKILESEPQSIRSINPQVDAFLEKICMRCLLKAPEDRYGSADALAEDLVRWTSRQQGVLGWLRRRIRA